MKKIPWYLRYAELFFGVVLIICFLIGGSIAYIFSRLIFDGGKDMFELAMSACCLLTVAVGGVSTYLWLIKKSEE